MALSRLDAIEYLINRGPSDDVPAAVAALRVLDVADEELDELGIDETELEQADRVAVLPEL